MKYFTEKQWRVIPLKLKLKWWNETNYGKIKPSTKLLKEINMEINKMHNAPIRTDLYNGSLNSYQDAAQTTAIYPGKGTFNGLIYTALKMNGEAGELAEKVGKIMRDNDGLVSLEKRDEMAKECGDVLWYIAAAAKELGYTLDEIARLNLTKLKDRQDRDKLSGSGDNR